MISLIKKKYNIFKNFGVFCILAGGLYTLHISYLDTIKRKKYIDI